MAAGTPGEPGRRRLATGLAMAGALMLVALAPAQAEAPSSDTPAEAASRVDLWPSGVGPGSVNVDVQQAIVERSDDPTLPDRIITGITRPYMTVHRPARPNGAALLVMPGGAYRRIVLDKEGSALVPVFGEAMGYTLFVLRYRLPGEGHEGARDVPLADAQRAMRVIRARADSWGIDPGRVAAIGFSAGGHVAASLGTRHGEPVYAPVDASDRLSARPDALLLMYPVIDMGGHAHPLSREKLLGLSPTPADIDAYSLQHRVHAGMPPTFVLHAEDDASVALENSLAFVEALRREGVPHEFHAYAEGGHGFGVRDIAGLPLALWPRMADAWMQAQWKESENHEE